MGKSKESVRDKKELAREIDRLGVYIDSGMFNGEQLEHFKERLKSLRQLYEQPE